MSKYICSCGAPTQESFDMSSQDYYTVCSTCRLDPDDCGCPRPWYERLIDAVHDVAYAIRGDGLDDGHADGND